jgi:hypothetical protein
VRCAIVGELLDRRLSTRQVGFGACCPSTRTTGTASPTRLELTAVRGMVKRCAGCCATSMRRTRPRADLKLMRSLPHGHVAAALGMLRKLGLDDVLAQGQRRRARMVALVTALVVARLLDPASKLTTGRLLGRHHIDLFARHRAEITESCCMGKNMRRIDSGGFTVHLRSHRRRFQPIVPRPPPFALVDPRPLGKCCLVCRCAESTTYPLENTTPVAQPKNAAGGLNFN